MHCVLSKGSAVGRPNQWSDVLTAILVCYSLCICAISLYGVRMKPMEQISHSIIYIYVYEYMSCVTKRQIYLYIYIYIYTRIYVVRNQETNLPIYICIFVNVLDVGDKVSPLTHLCVN
jgi:hypothetical protein